MRGDQRAKIEHYEGSLLVVLKTLRYVEDTSDVETGEVMVFLGDRFVVTVRRGDANPLAGVRARLEQNAEHLSLGPAAVLHAVMDSVVDNYILVDQEIHEDLEHIEQLVFSGTRGVDATVIYRLKREVLEIRRASQPLAEAMERLFVQPHRAIVDRDGSDVLAFFRDVKDHLLKVNDHVESYDRLLSDILSAHWHRSRRPERRHAEDLGMDRDRRGPDDDRRHLRDELREHPRADRVIRRRRLRVLYGYFVVLALMAVVCLGLYRAFKRSGWL